MFSAPGGVSSAGREAVELAAMVGLVLDPWQQFVLEQSLAEDGRGRWSAFEVGLVVARQNGKGSLLEARELAGLFLFGEQLIIHSAHLFDTSLEAFRRVLSLIESEPSFDSRVKRVSRSHGEEGIELKSGQRLRFKTRTAGGGRGLSGDVVILDEAMILSDKAVAALMPTMSARSITGNPQLWYTGSAGDEDSGVLARVRRRGLAGDDPSLCYAEWSVDEDEYRADPRGVSRNSGAWAQANPGLGIRISAEHIGREQRSMDAAEFARERLGVGTWPSDDESGRVIPSELWVSSCDPGSEISGRLVFAVDVAPDRSSASIGSAGQRADGKDHGELIDCRPGTAWVVSRLVELSQAWSPWAVVVDPGSPTGSLLPALASAGIDVMLTSARDVGQASGAFYDSVVAGNFRHIGQDVLSDAVAGATKRQLGDAWTWNRRDMSVDISSLCAVTLARWGFTVKLGEVLDVAASVW